MLKQIEQENRTSGVRMTGLRQNRLRAWVLAAIALTWTAAAPALTLAPQIQREIAPQRIEARLTPKPVRLRLDSELRGMPASERVVHDALSLVGTAYRLGAEGEDAIDCSALVQRVFRAVGLTLPRTAREQLQLGAPIPLHAVRKGDLLFYRWQPRQLHVAVYVDENWIVHASPTRGAVVMTRMNRSWRERLVAARRLI